MKKRAMKLTPTKFQSKVIEYRKTHTLKETGKKFNITGERVRQIIFVTNRKFCLVHNRFYYNSCAYCLNIKKYAQFMKKLDYDFVLYQVKEESSNRKRDYMSVQKKVYLVKVLKNKYNKSFKEIAVLFNRHISTIKNLYCKSL
jgi:hypothetical protein